MHERRHTHPERDRTGGRKATDELLPLVYEELRLLAAQKLAHENPGQTLQATALVHEAYLRLVGDEPQAGTTAAISLPLPRKPCGGSWSRTPGTRDASDMGGRFSRVELESRGC